MTTELGEIQRESTEIGPPKLSVGVVGWLRQNLFNTWYNSILTVLALTGIYYVLSGIFSWAVATASFGTTRDICRASEGACWGFIIDNWYLFAVGTYPWIERSRPFIIFGLLALLALFSLHPRVRGNWWVRGLWFLSPVIVLIVIKGGAVFGLNSVDTTSFGGLMLTLILSVFGIVLSFPIGIALALGRRSKQLPVVKALCVAYIEMIRGVPLITVLFMSSVVLPLFLPEGWEIDKVLRAQIGIILFSAAYLAEVVRGGLQAIPRGQEEAAQALGLNYWKVTVFIVLPQALRIMIPALVSGAIGLFKDTSLVTIIGLIDFLSIAVLATANPEWVGQIIEAYAFIALIYWVFCFSMSRYSARLELRLKAGQY